MPMGHISCIVDERKSLSRPAYDVWRMTHGMGKNMTGLVSIFWGRLSNPIELKKSIFTFTLMTVCWSLNVVVIL